MINRKYEDLKIGDSGSLKQTATDEYVAKMAELTGDTNPVHLDDEYAKSSFFGQRIAHGLFCDAMVSTVLGTDMPGGGNIYMEKHIQFRAPIYIGEEIETTVTITDLADEKRFVSLSFKCEKADGTVAAKGDARVKMP